MIDGEEPAPHVPERVVPLSFGRLRLDATVRRAEIRAALTLVCESPIEVDLGAALVEFAAGRFDVVPQVVLGRFRFDFALKIGSRVLAFVECDGDEWHSTPEQSARDKAKDAAAASIGFLVFHATGWAIYQRADDIAREIIGTLVQDGAIEK